MTVPGRSFARSWRKPAYVRKPSRSQRYSKPLSKHESLLANNRFSGLTESGPGLSAKKSKKPVSRRSNNYFLRLMPLFWKTTEKAFCNNRSSIRLPCSPLERQLPRTPTREINFSGEDLRQLSQIGARPFPLQTNRGRSQRNIQPKIRHFSR